MALHSTRLVSLSLCFNHNANIKPSKTFSKSIASQYIGANMFTKMQNAKYTCTVDMKPI